MGYIDQGTWRRKGAIMALISFVTTFVFGFLWRDMIGIW